MCAVGPATVDSPQIHLVLPVVRVRVPQSSSEPIIHLIISGLLGRPIIHDSTNDSGIRTLPNRCKLMDD